MAKDAPTMAGVTLSHLDQPVFDGADVTKGDLVAYLDAVHERICLLYTSDAADDREV